ncbi:MAG: Tat pathway signal protein [Brevundimonas sp.]|uniref:esterase-like activity of phytase family protein n=1 Tax=Brevundimonas sp. TaxID=1871086 RepID=UPI00122711F4|nr:esterase-like activity of phytase family protein [Brevundimonas sp.]RZJ19583.1 MAG: Tat pathway signal protein [Brevundimonas sp.]
MTLRRLLTALLTLSLAACAGAGRVSETWAPRDATGWTAVGVSTRAVGLGLPGGAVLAPGVRFAGGLNVVVEPTSPFRSLSDLKLTGSDGFVTVSDTGDLALAALRLDRSGRLVGLDNPRIRRLTGMDGLPITDKVQGDAEGLILTPTGDLLVSFERDHRIWTYGPLAALTTPRPVASPDYAFALNDGMEGIAAAPGGWRVTGESGGVWDCAPAGGCLTVVAPPEPLLQDGDYRITGMDRDPAGDGWFVVQRRYTPPIDARARVRRMAPDGALGPVLIELKLPGTTDNFEGVAAETRAGRTRLYILSDDNFSPAQRTLLLAFDLY